MASTQKKNAQKPSAPRKSGTGLKSATPAVPREAAPPPATPAVTLPPASTPLSDDELRRALKEAFQLEKELTAVERHAAAAVESGRKRLSAVLAPVFARNGAGPYKLAGRVEGMPDEFFVGQHTYKDRAPVLFLKSIGKSRVKEL